LTTWHCILSVELTKTHFFRLGWTKVLLQHLTLLIDYIYNMGVV